MPVVSALLIYRLELAGVLAFLALPQLLPPALGLPHDVARVAQVVMLVGASVWAILRPTTARQDFSGWWTFAGVALAVAVSSACFAAVPTIAMREIALITGLVGVAWLVSASYRDSRNRVVAYGIATAWALYAIVFLLLYGLVLATQDTPNSWLLIFGFDNPRFLNHAQTVALPLLLGITLSTGTRMAWRRWSGFALVIGFVLLAVTFGRATLLALAVAALFCPLLFGRVGLRFAGWMGGAAALGLLIYMLMFEWVPALLGTSFTSVQVHNAAEATSDHSRFYLWRIAVGHIAESPWLGIGPMHFAHVPNLKGAHPHNVYLQAAAEYGLPFLALVVGGTGIALIRAARGLRRLLAQGGEGALGIPLLMGAFCACVAAAVDGGFSGNFVMPVSQVWIAVAAGLLAGGLIKRSNLVLDVKASTALAPRGIGVLLLTAQLGLAYVTISEFVGTDSPRIGSAAVSTAMTSSDNWRPRFWLDGWF